MNDNAMQFDSRVVDADLDRACLRFELERYEESNAILFSIVDSGLSTSYICFCIGRNFFHLERTDLARLWLSRAIDLPNPFRWTYYELARVLEADDDAVEAARNLTFFIRTFQSDSARPDLNSIHIATLLRIAHKCFDADKAEAANLYRLIHETGIRDYICELRIIEAQIDAGNIESARRQMVVLLEHHSLDPWGQLALSRIQFAKGETGQAVSTVIAATEMQRDNLLLKATAGHRLVEFRAYNEATDFIEKNLLPHLGQSADFDCQIHGITFRLNVMRRDHAQIVLDCQTPGLLACLPNWLVVEALFSFALPGEQITQPDIEVASELSAFLESQKPYSLGTILSLYQFYSRRRMWTALAELDDRINDSDFFDHHEVRMRRFETLCAMSRMDEAREFYDAHYATAKLRQWEACVVLRFLAEAKMWDESAALLETFIDERYHFPEGDYFLLKICRRTHLHRNIIARIDQAQFGDLPDQYPALRALLVDDLIIQQAALGARDLPGTTSISRANAVLLKHPPGARPGEVAVFLCADKAYFLSVLTFLASFACHDDGAINIEWLVFLARDVPLEWQGLLQDFAGKINLRVEIVPEEEFVDCDAIHIETYGIFTGGNTLSRAAFLRIYAASYLFALGRFNRAIYVDSDIVCQKGFSGLAELEFQDTLLMARAEEPSPEVQSVIQKHGLAEMSYFNSGVLVFNFSGRRAAERLAEAIDLSERHQGRLVFHDQCALNIAFANEVRFLDPKFNYFLRPHRPDNGDFSNAVLLHFLDKPKPWDVSYHREYRSTWVRYAELVRTLLRDDLYSALVASANR